MTVDSVIGFRTTQGLIPGGRSGMNLNTIKITHPTMRVLDAKVGTVLAEHFGHEDGSFSLRMLGSLLLDDGTVIAPGGLVGDRNLYAIRFPYGGLAKTGWPVSMGDNQHTNRFALAEPTTPP